MEGVHHCEAACRTVHGYQLGDPFPLDQIDIPIPPTSTLFWPILTYVYYTQDSNMKLNGSACKRLKEMFVKVAEQKKQIIPITWNYFFNKVLDDITKNTLLWEALFDEQEEFYQEEVLYREITSKKIRSNQIKRHLHDVLTHAIFHYSPCKDLLIGYKKKPTEKAWLDIPVKQPKWVSLNAEPYQNVSESIIYCQIIYQLLLSNTQS